MSERVVRIVRSAAAEGEPTKYRGRRKQRIAGKKEHSGAKVDKNAGESMTIGCAVAEYAASISAAETATLLLQGLQRPWKEQQLRDTTSAYGIMLPGAEGFWATENRDAAWIRFEAPAVAIAVRTALDGKPMPSSSSNPVHINYSCLTPSEAKESFSALPDVTAGRAQVESDAIHTEPTGSAIRTKKTRPFFHESEAALPADPRPAISVKSLRANNTLTTAGAKLLSFATGETVQPVAHDISLERPVHACEDSFPGILAASAINTASRDWPCNQPGAQPATSSRFGPEKSGKCADPVLGADGALDTDKTFVDPGLTEMRYPHDKPSVRSSAAAAATIREDEYSQMRHADNAFRGRELPSEWDRRERADDYVATPSAYDGARGSGGWSQSRGSRGDRHGYDRRYVEYDRAAFHPREEPHYPAERSYRREGYGHEQMPLRDVRDVRYRSDAHRSGLHRSDHGQHYQAYAEVDERYRS